MGNKYLPEGKVLYTTPPPPKPDKNIPIITGRRWSKKELIDAIENNNRYKIRNRKNKADIFISIPSRNKPDFLIESATRLIDSCNDRDNFDIVFIIDEDQKEMYQNAINICKPDFVRYTKYIGADWSNIQKEANSLFESTNHYFFMPFADDVFGLSIYWDAVILSKKHYIEDDIFLLYTNSTYFGRNPEANEKCYYLHGNCCIAQFGETMPIWTRKLFEYINPISSKYKGLRDFFYLATIYLLYKKYNINRNIKCNINFNYAINDGTSMKIFDEIWDLISKNDFEILHETVKDIKEEITGIKENDF